MPAFNKVVLTGQSSAVLGSNALQSNT